MAISFLPTSTFGIYGLRQLQESRNIYVAAQLLYVDPSTPGDRTTWTWEANWSQYVIPGAFSGTGGSLNITTQGASPPATATLYEEATSQFPGAYTEFASAYPDGGFIYMYNNSVTTYTYTHVAIFAMQGSLTNLSNIAMAEQSLYQITYPVEIPSLDPTTATLDPYTGIKFSVGSAYTLATSFSDWTARDEATTTFDPPPYPVIITPSIARNLSTSANVLDNYKTLMGITATDTTTSFLAELLNVTGTEPDFEAGWSGWSTYRINRYSTISFVPTYTYTPRTASYTVTFDGTDYAVTTSGTEVGYSNVTEFVFTPPEAGSYTFTHIAVFANEIDTPPQQNTVYTYTDTNKFIGVIKLDSGITVSSTDPNYAFPFKFTYMYEPDQTFEEI